MSITGTIKLHIKEKVIYGERTKFSAHIVNKL